MTVSQMRYLIRTIIFVFSLLMRKKEEEEGRKKEGKPNKALFAVFFPLSFWSESQTVLQKLRVWNPSQLCRFTV